MHNHASPTTQIQPTSAASQPEQATHDVPVQELSQSLYMYPLEALSLSTGDGTIQRKLSIGSADDELEQEADTMADTVMRKAQTPFVQRKCADCEKEEQVQAKPFSPFIQKKGGETATATDAVSSQIQSSRGKGSPLSETTKSFMENSFGTDFSQVKIHTDTQAADLSQQLNAQAFTVGNDIYFNQGKYNPHSSSGQHLLAHELTHTLQQQRNTVQPKHIQRQEEVSEHYMGGFTHPTPIKTDEYQDTSSSKISGYNYWFAKLTSIYKWDDNWVLNTPPFTMGPPEWNAILSKAWDLKPATVPTATNAGPFTASALVPVVLPAPKNEYRVHCRFTYRYDTTSNKPVFKLEVLSFIAVAAAPVDANKAPQIIKKSQEIQKQLDGASNSGFPGNNLSSYFARHPEVKETLAGYIQAKFEAFKKGKQSSDFRLNELVKIKEVNGTTETPLLLHLIVSGSRDAGVYLIDLVYSQEQSNTLSADYNQKDYADFRIEKDQKDHPTDPVKMGQIKGLDAITNTDERRIIKNLAVDFFTNETDKAGVKTRTFRDTEIDQIVPISPLPTDPAKTSFLYYTFIVHKPDANNLVNITVKKIGQKGDATVGDPDKGVVARIPGYTENAYDAKQAETPAKLVTWLLARYKGVKKADIDAPTVADVTSKMNALIESQAGTTDWFKNNYSIKILDAADAKTRLNTAHKRPLKIPDPSAAPGTKAADIDNPDLDGLKTYSASELKFLELSLEKFTLPLLKQLQGVQMIRQTKDLANKLAGLTLQSGYTYNSATKVIDESTLKRSIIIYDSAFTEKGSFLGGTEGVNPAATSSITHELGHVIGHRKSVMKHGVPSHQDKFNDFYKALSLTPVTTYAKDTSDPSHSPDTEYFPEALMLFMTDPEWLLHNQYQTYFWFLYLQDKGSPPSQDQAKSMSSVWEAMKALPGSNTLAEAASVYAMWKAYAAQKAKVPDAAATTTLVAIVAAFLAAQTRPMREGEATAIVKKWLAFKSKTAPTTDEIKTFLP